MAGYGGQLVALDVNNPVMDIGAPLQEANQIQAGQLQNKTSALELQNQLMQRSALLDYYKSLNSPQTPAAPNPATAPPPTPAMLISGAATTADTPEAWDAAMSKIAQSGVPEAGQFVGRFTPKLKEQVVASYGQPPANAPASPLSAVGAAPASPLGAVGPSAGSPASPLAAAPTAGPTSPLAASGTSPAGVSPLARLAVFNPTAASNIANLQARMRYAQSGDVSDLRIDPQAMAQVATATKDMTESQKAKFGLTMDAAGRAATAALTIPAGPQRDAYMGQAFDQMKRNGLVPPNVEPHSGPITDDMLQHMQASSMTVDQYMKVSGQEAGNEARAQLPSELAKIGATGAQARQTEAFKQPLELQRIAATGDQARQTERVKPIIASPDQSVIDPTQLDRTAASAPASSTATAGVPLDTNKFAAEVPAYQLPGGAPPSSGVIKQGKTPSQTAAENAAVDQYKETASVAQAAADVKGQLGTMKAQLDQGLNTNALAPQKAIISAYLNAAVSPEFAKQITGIDPAQADVFNKDATRLGFALSRTLGAREAAQTIQAAIKANPNMMNTLQGNQTVIGLLDKTADRQIDAQQFADAYYQKNGHYIGAEAAFNKTHPAAEYVSQAVPYSLPLTAAGALNPDALQPNVTYTTPKGKFVWDAIQKHFAPAP